MAFCNTPQQARQVAALGLLMAVRGPIALVILRRDVTLRFQCP
ncbi:Unknown protein sequence [Pseudomonas savastanoi pv. phaseolicola]|nr:Unknown protein sequence [Pseudomonas savastanoi pv. phaseolicola]